MCPDWTQKEIGKDMGLFDFFKRKPVKQMTDTEYIMHCVKSGLLLSREFPPDDTVEIARRLVPLKPVGTSKPAAQRTISTLSEGQHLHMYCQENNGQNCIYFETKNHQPIGYIEVLGDNLKLITEMLSLGIDVECVVSRRGKFFADGRGEHLWYCELTMPFYDVWSSKDADVWVAPGGRTYHRSPKCRPMATMNMREEEAVQRGYAPCKRCCKPPQDTMEQPL